MKRLTLLAGAALATVTLGACVIDGGGIPPAPVDSCGSAGLQYLVGQPETVLQTQILSGPVRILRPNMATTMDYSANRLNVFVDETGRITRIYCG